MPSAAINNIINIIPGNPQIKRALSRLYDTDLTKIDGVTNGTVTASKAVVVDANKDISEFRNMTATNVIIGVGGSINSDSGVATASAGAATLAKMAGIITTEALTTAALADYTLTLTNSAIAAADMVFASVNNGTNTTAGIDVQRVSPAAGSVVILIRNTHATVALNGTLKISFLVVKA